MTVNAITDTKKGRTGIAPTYLHTTRTYLSEHDFIVLMVIQVEIYFVTSATLNGIWCIVTVSDLQQQQQALLV